jgi:hypothetical protein
VKKIAICARFLLESRSKALIKDVGIYFVEDDRDKVLISKIL